MMQFCKKVRLAGLEPTASASAGLRSIQLSYKRTKSLLVSGLGSRRKDSKTTIE